MVLLGCTAFWVLGASVVARVAESVIVFPIGVLFVAARFGIGPAICTTVASVLLYDFLFILPTRTLVVADSRSFLTLAVMLAVAATATVLAEQLRRREDDAHWAWSFAVMFGEAAPSSAGTYRAIRRRA